MSVQAQGAGISVLTAANEHVTDAQVRTIHTSTKIMNVVSGILSALGIAFALVGMGMCTTGAGMLIGIPLVLVGAGSVALGIYVSRIASRLGSIPNEA
jgi:hypothetical protein